MQSENHEDGKANGLRQKELGEACAECQTSHWPLKAYDNLTFLNCPDARILRVLAEFIEPESRFKRMGVNSTIVFFGSARTLPEDVAKQKLDEVEARMAAAEETDHALQTEHEHAVRAMHMAKYYEDAAALAERLTKWSQVLPPAQQFRICSGGGPGIMEAANRGAANAGGLSIGLNISLPFEQNPNPYITRDLEFEFHYFFIRKFWFSYLARALVVFPGGFGTVDELFEILTLIQTRKIGRSLPVIIYGSDYWHEILNFDAMVKWGMVSSEDLSLFKFCDDVDTAFECLRDALNEHPINKRWH